MFARDLNLLLLGDEVARATSARVDLVRPALITCAVLVTGAAVAASGTPPIVTIDCDETTMVRRYLNMAPCCGTGQAGGCPLVSGWPRLEPRLWLRIWTRTWTALRRRAGNPRCRHRSCVLG